MSFRAKSSERGISRQEMPQRDSSEDLGMTIKSFDYFCNNVLNNAGHNKAAISDLMDNA
jgi:hypothetical protein